MNPFTYKDYKYYKKFFRMKSNNLNENQEKYDYNMGKRKKVEQPHDKIFKEVLEDKEETIKFINKFLKLENTIYELKEGDIEKYNRKFISRDFYNIESDIVYKKIDQNIFFLIEHQSTIDYSMPYRILKYNMAIMDSAIDTKKVKNKNYKLPIIFSFVIYTGNNKWNANKYLFEKQEILRGCKQKSFANFQIIDINDYTKEELLSSDRLLLKLMLLEKARNMEELENYLTEIIEKKMDGKQKMFLMRVVNYILKDKIQTEALEKINKKLEEKKGEGSMTLDQKIGIWIHEMVEERFVVVEKEIAERKAKADKEVAERKAKVNKEVAERKAKVDKEIAEMKTKVEKEVTEREEKANKEIAIKLLKNDIDEDRILNIIGIEKSELDKIKKENELALIS